MGKIIVPSNVELTRNAIKQIQKIESNRNYDGLVGTINKYLRYAASTPTDIYAARENGWRIEKMHSASGDNVYSIRITQGDRFTYRVARGIVSILGVLGHYIGTEFARYSISFDDMKGLADDFYKGRTTISDISKESNSKVVPIFGDDNMVKALEFINENGEYSILPREDFVYDKKQELINLKEELLSNINNEEEKEETKAKAA